MALSRGGVYLYKGKPVYITDGEYMGTHGVSNYWHFKYINKDGTLGTRDGDYDNEKDKFIPILNAKVEIKVIFPSY